MVVAPPASYCPHHPVLMTPDSLPGIGEIVSFTTLHTPPAGFKSPLHLAIVELDGGARFVCHGSDVQGLKVGTHVLIDRCRGCACWTSRGCWPAPSAR